jgi:hypothetical protein
MIKDFNKIYNRDIKEDLRDLVMDKLLITKKEIIGKTIKVIEYDNDLNQIYTLFDDGTFYIIIGDYDLEDKFSVRLGSISDILYIGNIGRKLEILLKLKIVTEKEIENIIKNNK